MVRAGGVLSGGDRGELGPGVTLGHQPAADVGGHVGLGPADEVDLARLQLGHHPVGGGTRGPERGDLGAVLDRP